MNTDCFADTDDTDVRAEQGSWRESADCSDITDKTRIKDKRKHGCTQKTVFLSFLYQ